MTTSRPSPATACSGRPRKESGGPSRPTDRHGSSALPRQPLRLSGAEARTGMAGIEAGIKFHRRAGEGR